MLPETPPSRTAPTFLAVQPLEAQGAVALVALLPGPAAAPVRAGPRHAGVGCVLHVHAPREVVLHVDGAVVQDDLRGTEGQDVQALGTHLCSLLKPPSAPAPARRVLRELA